MNKKIILITLFIGVLIYFSSCGVALNRVKKENKLVISDDAISFHDSMPFIADLHSDALMRGKKLWNNNSLHVNFPKMRKGNAALQVFGVPTKSGIPDMDSNKEPKINLIGFVFPKLLFKNPYEIAIYQINKLHLAEKNDRKFHIIKSNKDLRDLITLRKKNKDHIGGILCIEGIHCIADSIKRIDDLYNRGIRIVGLAHFFDNQYSGSKSGKDKYGLTLKGKELLHRMDSLGIIVDLAHSSLSTIDDVLKYYSKPPIVSHVGCAKVLKSNRNLNDDYLLKIINAGGLIGVMFFNPIERKKVSADNIVDNILHLIQLNNGSTKGIALGSDYDGNVIVPLDISDLNIITDKLLQKGVSKNDIKLIMGENVKNYFINYL